TVGAVSAGAHPEPDARGGGHHPRGRAPHDLRTTDQAPARSADLPAGIPGARRAVGREPPAPDRERGLDRLYRAAVPDARAPPDRGSHAGAPEVHAAASAGSGPSRGGRGSAVAGSSTGGGRSDPDRTAARGLSAQSIDDAAGDGRLRPGGRARLREADGTHPEPRGGDWTRTAGRLDA